MGPVGASKTARDPDSEAGVVLRGRALVSGRDVTVARAICPAPCDVKVTVSDGSRTLRRRSTVQGSVPLFVTGAGRLRPGRLRVRVQRRRA